MKHALVTGASTGIGKAVALRLAHRGWVVFAGVRTTADGERVAAESRDRRDPGLVIPTRLDVTQADQIAESFRMVSGRTPTLHALVNNAGIPVVGPVEAVPLDRWRTQFEVNLFGQIAVTQAALPLLRAAKGRIVLVSSIAGLVGQPFLSPYSASKHALEAVGDALRLELAPDGIGVTIVEPGAIKTPIWRRGEENTKAAEAGMTPELASRYEVRMTAVKRLAANAEAGGLSADQCAAVIENAILARRVPSRVLVGFDAKSAAFARWLLPERWFDALIRRTIGV